MAKLLSIQTPEDPEMTRLIARLQQIGQPVIPQLLEALNTAHHRENIVVALVTLIDNDTLPIFFSALNNTSSRVIEGLFDVLRRAETYDPNQLLGLFANPKLPGAKLEQLCLHHKPLLQPHALLRALPNAHKDHHTFILRLLD